MKKRMYLLWIVLSVYSAYGQQEKLAALVFTTASNEASMTFNEALERNDFGEVKQSRALFQKALQQDARFAAANLFLASMAISPNEFAQYLRNAKMQLEKSSDWEKLYYEYMETFLSDNRARRIEAAQKMVAMYPTNARSYTLLGEAFAAANDIGNARKNFQQAIEADPASPLGYRSLAESFLFQDPKEYKRAEQYAAKVVSMKPCSASYILLGDAYRAQNNLQKAKNAYGKAINADPEDPVAYYKRGHAFTFLGDFDKARTDYEKAGTLDVIVSTAIINSALTYLYEGQPAKGMQFLLGESGKLDTKDVAKAAQVQYELLNTAAAIAFHLGDKKTMAQIVELIEPLGNELVNGVSSRETQIVEMSDMLYLKACVQVLNEDYEKADALLGDMRALLEPIQNPRKLESYELAKGFISYRKKEYPLAVTHFENAYKQNVYAEYWLAKALEAGGNPEKATNLYKDIAHYNFNGIEYALIRNEVKQRF
jgi:tetratricopeptide (TPR) repeat protein